MGEILIIAVVALLAVGPDRLPQAARTIGRGLRDLRRQTTDLQQALERDAQIGDAVRELRSAWYGTTSALPKNRYELGRALDQMTADEVAPRPKTGDDGAPKAALPTHTDDATPGAADPVADASPAPEPDDDGLPRITAAPGTIARADETTAGAEPEGDGPADASEPAARNNPAHG